MGCGRVKNVMMAVQKPIIYRVEPLIKDTPNKEHLSIKDKSTFPNSYTTPVYILTTK